MTGCRTSEEGMSLAAIGGQVALLGLGHSARRSPGERERLEFRKLALGASRPF